MSLLLPTRCWAGIAAGLCVWFGFVTPVTAQTVLRWKFTPDEALAVAVEQQTSAETSGAEKSQVKIDMVANVAWRTTSVDADGTAKVAQNIDRLRLNMAAGTTLNVQYDSGANEAPTAAARQIASAIEPLVGAEFSLTMNPRGEILEVVPPAEFTAETQFSANIADLLRQTAIVFPEQPVAAGDTWDVEDEIDSPLGKLIRKRHYTYEGQVDREGRGLDRIRVETTIEPAAENEAKAKIVSQSQSGEFWFDTKLGRLVESSVTQELVTERTYRDLRTRVKTRSTLKSAMTPAD